MAKPNKNAALEALGFQPAILSVPEAAPAAQVVPLKAVQDDRADVARVMLYLHPKVAKKVKEIALHEDCKAHSIYLAALDEYLRGRGYGGLTDIAAR
jgi:hypothetical protein